MTEPRSRKLVLPMLAIAVLTLLAYLPAIGSGGFIWDDDSYLTANALVQSPSGLVDLWIPGRTPQYYPLVFTSFWLEFQAWGLEPAGYHAVNVLLHILTSILLWRILVRLGIPGAFAIALAFALHPMHVESVAWITERKNVLSGALYLTAAHAYLRFDRADRHALMWYAIALVTFAGALLSKSVTCSLPAALVLIMLLRGERLTMARLAPLGPFFVLGLALAWNTVLYERGHVGATGMEFDLSLLERFLVACRALVFYPVKLAAPWPIMFIYPRWDVTAGDPYAWGFVALVFIAAAWTIAEWRRGRRAPFIALAYFAGTIFPALGFLNVYPHRFSFVADHFAYLASIGVIALIVGGSVHLAQRLGRLPVARLIGVLVAVAYAAITWTQAATYRNAETVWRDSLAKNDGAWIAHGNLASILARRGAAELGSGASDARDRAAASLAEAFVHAERAVELMPDEPPLLATLAEIERLTGSYEDSARHHRHAIDIVMARLDDDTSPPMALAAHYVGLARALAALERHGEAARAYEAALAIADLPELYRDLAAARYGEGDLSGAIEMQRKWLSATPEDARGWYGLGQMERALGNDTEARNAMGAALRRMTSDQIDLALRVECDLARLLAESTEVGDPKRAVELAEHAAQVTQREAPGILDVLASVYFQVGRTEDAIDTADEAIRLARANGLEEMAQQIEARRARYRDGAEQGEGASAPGQ